MSSHSPLRRTSSRSSVRSTLARLAHVGLRVGVDLGAREHRPGGGAARGIADARGEVADDQHDGVAGVLELAQLAEHHRVAEVDVRRRRVQTELDAERPRAAKGAPRAPPRASIRRRCGPDMQPFRPPARQGIPSAPMLMSRPRAAADRVCPCVASVPGGRRAHRLRHERIRARQALLRRPCHPYAPRGRAGRQQRRRPGGRRSGAARRPRTARRSARGARWRRRRTPPPPRPEPVIPEVEGYAPVIPITRDTLLAPEPARPRRPDPQAARPARPRWGSRRSAPSRSCSAW